MRRPPSFLLHLQLPLCQLTILDKSKIKQNERTRIHAPTSVVNGEECVFSADTLLNFGGIIVGRGRWKRNFGRG